MLFLLYIIFKSCFTSQRKQVWQSSSNSLTHCKQNQPSLRRSREYLKLRRTKQTGQIRSKLLDPMLHTRLTHSRCSFWTIFKSSTLLSWYHFKSPTTFICKMNLGRNNGNLPSYALHVLRQNKNGLYIIIYTRPAHCPWKLLSREDSSSSSKQHGDWIYSPRRPICQNPTCSCWQNH